MMQWLRDFCRRRRVALCGLAVALAALLAAAWVWHEVPPQVDNRSTYEILNDEYDRTVRVMPGQGVSQQLPLPEGKTLYGMRLNVTTYSHGFRGGYLHADLYSADGQLLAQSAASCVGMADNTFADFVFDTPYTPEQDETLWLYITYEPTPAADNEKWIESNYPIGLWCTHGMVGEMPLIRGAPGDGGRGYNGTLAMQYIVNYTGSWSGVFALVIGGLTAAAVILGFVLLFAVRAHLAVVVAVAGLLLGSAFSVLTPSLVAPDEYTHLAVSYMYASELLGQPVCADEETRALLVRACDAPYFKTVTGDIGALAYKELAANLGQTGCDGATVRETGAYADPNRLAPLYLGQTAGVLLARALGLGFYAMLLCGRLGNLLVYLTLATLAVALSPPRGRGIFACVALLPMPLQLAASFSADSMVLGLIFAYTALCLRLRERPATRAETAALVLLTACIGPAKAIYLPVTLLCLLVPSRHLAATRRAGHAVKALALALAALLWGAVNLGALFYAARDVDTVGIKRAALLGAAALAVLALVWLAVRRRPAARRWLCRGLAAAVVLAIPVGFYQLTHMWGGLTPEQLVEGIQPNGDSIYTYSFGYICRNLPATVELLVRSVAAQGALWLQGLLGTTLGEPIVYRLDVSWLLGVGLVLLLLAAALPVGQDRLPLDRPARWGIGGILLLVVGLTFAAALSWTPINYATIFGVQGRYWLPVLPLALGLVGDNRTFTAQKDLTRPAVLGILYLTSLVMLQGYDLYATWQPTI